MEDGTPVMLVSRLMLDLVDTSAVTEVIWDDFEPTEKELALAPDHNDRGQQ